LTLKLYFKEQKQVKLYLLRVKLSINNTVQKLNSYTACKHKLNKKIYKSNLFLPLSISISKWKKAYKSIYL